MTSPQPIIAAIAALFLVATVVIILLARRRVRTTAGFYVAENSVSVVQNGIATAGDYLSAASFLGTIAVFFTSGTDGVLYAVGAVAGWPVLACLLAEPLRNLGRFTFADALCQRLEERPIRLLAGVSTLVICCGYLISQMVAAGTVLELLSGLPYGQAILVVGALMVCYVLFGGMVATTWIQIIKATALLLVVALMAALVLHRFGWNAADLSRQAAASMAERVGPQKVLLEDPFSALGLALAFIFGPAGMPHVLMRSFTVRDGVAARRSLVVATCLIALFQALIIALGLGAMAMLRVPEVTGVNTAAFFLARHLGGSVLFGVAATVAIATVLAVVAGLTLAAATTVSHDLARTVFKRRAIQDAQELRISRWASAGIGAVAVGFGILFQHQNVGFLATLPLVAAASATFPVLLLAIHWRGLTTRGAVAAGWTGLLGSIALVLVSPKVWVGTFGHAAPLVPFEYPTVITMAAAFLLAWGVSRLDTRGGASSSAPRPSD